MKMYRDEVVTMMCDLIDNYNRFGSLQSGMDPAQVEAFISQGRQQLEYVNGMLYDMLKENGIINN